VKQLALLIVVGLIPAAGAEADPLPVSLTIGAGVVRHDQDAQASSQSTWDGGITATFGYRIALGRSMQLTIGGHLAASRLQYKDAENGTIFNYDYSYRLVPFDVAFAVQVVRPPIWLVGWVGRRFARVSFSEVMFVRNVASETSYPTEWRDRFLSFGATLGADLLTRGNHHLGIFIDYANGRRAGHDPDIRASDEDARFSTLSFGIVDRI